MLAEMHGGAGEPTGDRPEPKSFAEARTAGRDAMDAMQNSNFLLESLPSRLESESNPEVQQELRQQLQQAEEESRVKREEAIEYFRIALTLANADMPTEDINLVRLYLAHLFFLRGDYFDSGVLSEFVARRFPADNASREASKIALAAYAQLYAQAPAEERQFETRQLKAWADYIIRQWPDQAVAADAWNALIPFVAQEGEFSRMVAGLERIPETSPQRGELELKVGRALWAAYRQGMSDLRRDEREGNVESPQLTQRKEELGRWKTEAQQILVAGLDRVRAKNQAVDESLALGALYLAQVYVDSQQAGDALALLQDEQVGPLALVSRKHPVAGTSGYAEETYKTALRAYLADVQPQDPQATLARAKGIMADLKDSVTADAAGQQRLIAVYVGLARDMKTQMEMASDEERHLLSRGFSLFLSELGRESNDFQILNWIGETFFNMAESQVSADAVQVPAEAAALYEQTLEAYRKILAQYERDSSFLPSPQFATLLRLRVAIVHRQLGQFKEAMEYFKQILGEKNQMVNVQVEAARTFQRGAAAPGFHSLYEKAIMGEYRDPSAKPPANIVWGWGKIAKLTAGREDFQEVFFESRYNLALCRFEYAKRVPDADTKKRWLDLARQDVLFTFRLYPELGGSHWKSRFDRLLKQIQQTRGEQPLGLAEFASERQTVR
jgi:cellulose synthase operon protein C